MKLGEEPGKDTQPWTPNPQTKDFDALSGVPCLITKDAEDVSTLAARVIMLLEPDHEGMARVPQHFRFVGAKDPPHGYNPETCRDHCRSATLPRTRPGWVCLWDPCYSVPNNGQCFFLHALNHPLWFCTTKSYSSRLLHSEGLEISMQVAEHRAS